MRRTALALAWLALLACERAPRHGDRNAPIAVLTGHVRLAAGSSLPEYTALDLAEPSLHASPALPAPDECAAQNRAAQGAVELDAGRGLRHVLVAGSDFTRFREPARRVHKVAIEHCRLWPPTIDATIGDILELENRDHFAFQPMLGPAFRARTLAAGRNVRVPLVPGRFDSIACSRSAPCGRTDVAVFFHPIHAVSGATGAFRIEQFPANELVRVSAWHPLFDVTETFVWLEPGQHAEIELELKPKAAFTRDETQRGR